MYRLEYKKKAAKALAKLEPIGLRQKIRDELRKVASNPGQYEGDWKELKGTEYHRLRLGGYRAICELVDDKLILWVLDVGARGDIYK
ncbi:MAG: type II toxin-antitoxin system RelE/ParE family toxin [Gammaproteobacteria bacterium]|nr:type II toxin-antitoxin system RelE/ParE family toxin [Gammaproteobacteria bacterium]MBU1654438.1 type II toxin-antitoxin system RelE/ParE family toxin [Gammaproteobacteria bacterium]MBU1960748.1 type II toxin-antitoxin system RelE/ParE family toxin [Gammaproteobacteria bacterium]